MDNNRTSNKVVVVKNVVKKYGRNVVLKNVCLDVLRGERVVIVGPNGSGKTTLMKVVLGLTLRDYGVVKVFGIDPLTKQFDKIRREIGYLPEKVTLIQGMKVEEYLNYVSAIKRCYNYEDVMELLELIKYRNQRIKVLSQGYKRRVLLAAAFLCNPKLLVLDEPYANIDVDTRIIIDDFLRNIPKDITLLMATHVEPSLDRYTAVIVMDGNIVSKVIVESALRFILTCGDEVIELSEKELSKVNDLIKHGCYLKEVSISNLMNYLRKVIRKKFKVNFST